MICMTLVDSATIPIDDLRGIQFWHDFEYCNWLQLQPSQAKVSCFKKWGISQDDYTYRYLYEISMYLVNHDVTLVNGIQSFGG